MENKDELYQRILKAKTYLDQHGFPLDNSFISTILAREITSGNITYDDAKSIYEKLTMEVK